MTAVPHPSVTTRLPWPWLTLALLALVVPLSALAAAGRNTACVPHEIAHALRAVSRTTAVVLEGRPATDLPDTCPHTVQPVRDDMTPTL